MARASDWRPLLTGTSAAQAGPGNLASFAPIDRPVCLAAAGRPDANPPEGLATWTGPTPATWPTSGPLVAPVHSTLRADPNPHPKRARDRLCWSGTTAWADLPGRYTVRGRPAPNPGGGALLQPGPPSWHPSSGGAVFSRPTSTPMETRRCAWALLPPLWTPTSATKLIATAPNGRETLGLRPALRQAALVCRRGRGRGGASGDQATVGRTTSPFGDSFGVCSPLPKLLGARPAYETCPAGTSSPP